MTKMEQGSMQKQFLYVMDKYKNRWASYKSLFFRWKLTDAGRVWFDWLC